MKMTALMSRLLALPMVLAATLAAAGDAPSAAAAPDPELAALLTKAAQYAERSEKEIQGLVAEESYDQSLLDAGGHLLGRRILRSDVSFVSFAGPLRWLPLRDVFQVDSKPVRERDHRLETLFAGTPTDAAFEKAQPIIEQSAGYNLGSYGRTFNVPTLALVFLHPASQPRFVFRKKGKKPEKVGADTAWVVEYEETRSPAFVADELGHDVFVKGKLWIEESEGRVLRSELSVKRLLWSEAKAKTASDAASIGNYQVDLTVEFGPGPEGAVWVPKKMTEFCKTTTAGAQHFVQARESVGGMSGGTDLGETVRSTATYSAYRKKN